MCDVDYSDSDEPSVWNERWQKARKPYRCACCRTAIAVGEKYLYHFSVSDGNAWTDRLCEACHKIRDQFKEAHNGQLPCPASLEETLVDCIDERDAESLKWKPVLEEIRTRKITARAET